MRVTFFFEIPLIMNIIENTERITQWRYSCIKDIQPDVALQMNMI